MTHMIDFAMALGGRQSTKLREPLGCFLQGLEVDMGIHPIHLLGIMFDEFFHDGRAHPRVLHHAGDGVAEGMEGGQRGRRHEL